MDKYFSNMNSEKRLYTLQALPIHLINARQTERLQRLLTDFLFIEAKIDALGPASLIIDFDLILTWDLSIPKESIEILKILRNVIQLSTHILIQDKTQLVGQLIGHLISQKFPAIQALLENAVRSTTGSWLCPLAPSLIPPDSLLRQTLIGHEDYIHAVAITPDGRYGISVEMKKLIMWNIEHGVLLHTFASNVDNDEFSEGFEEVMVTAGGQHAIVIDGSLVKLLNIEHGKELRTWKSHAYLHSIGVTYNGQEIYA